jgi:hypothetical protein
MSPHWSAIFLQHSRSADVIAAPGNTHIATGSAANISASAETPKRNERGKVSPNPPSRESFKLGCPLAVQ